MYISCRSPMYSTQRMCCIVLRGRRYQTKADRTMLLPVALQSGKGGYKVTKNFSPDNDLVSQHLPSAKDPEQRVCFYRTQGCIILLDILSIALCRKRGILKGISFHSCVYKAFVCCCNINSKVVSCLVLFFPTLIT